MGNIPLKESPHLPHLQGVFQVAQHEATIADRRQGDLGIAAQLRLRVDHGEAVVLHLGGLWMVCGWLWMVYGWKIWFDDV